MITMYPPAVRPGVRYTPGEAARLLGIHPNSLLNHRKAGNIEFSTVERMNRHGKPYCTIYFTDEQIMKFWRGTV